MKYHAKSNREEEIEVVQVEQDSTIATAYGPATITAGNYIATLSDGSQVGITEHDLLLNYRKVRSDTLKKKSSNKA